MQRGFVALFKSYGSAILSKCCALHVSIGDDHFVIGNPDARPEDSAIVQIHDALDEAHCIEAGEGLGDEFEDAVGFMMEREIEAAKRQHSEKSEK